MERQKWTITGRDRLKKNTPVLSSQTSFESLFIFKNIIFIFIIYLLIKIIIFETKKIQKIVFNYFQELTAFYLAAELYHIYVYCFLFYAYLCHNSRTDSANCKTRNQCDNIIEINSNMYTLQFLNISLLMISCSFYAFLRIYRVQYKSITYF